VCQNKEGGRLARSEGRGFVGRGARGEGESKVHNSRKKTRRKSTGKHDRTDTTGVNVGAGEGGKWAAGPPGKQ